MRVGSRVLQLLLLPALVVAQFKGGSLSWSRVSDSSNVVRFTLRSMWIRSSQTYVKVVNGVAEPTAQYQPILGDIINVLGFETPKFVVSTGFETYLQLQVTFNTEATSDQYDHEAGLNKPHENDHWSHNHSNWFEGISHWDVEIPDPHKTYVAEFQGCCRDYVLIPNEKNIRFSRGLIDMFNTPYHLSATVRLDLDPPPVSFLPHFVPFQTKQSATVLKLVLPILDFKGTSSGMSDPGTTKHFQTEAEKDWASFIENDDPNRAVPIEFMDMNPLPPIAMPGQVMASAKISGTSVRMLKHSDSMLTLFGGDGVSPGCTDAEQVVIPAGIDLCAESSYADLRYPSGTMVFNFTSGMANITAITVPPGLTLELSDSCEFSHPPPGPWEAAADPFSWGRVIKSCTGGCCILSEEDKQGLVMFRTKTRAASVVSSEVTLIPLVTTNGYFQIELEAPNLLEGNYPVQLKVATATSAATTFEFMLHVMKSTGMTISEGEDTTAQNYIPSPIGFQHKWKWDLAPDSFRIKRKFFYDNLGGGVFGPDAPNAALSIAESGTWELEWTPCLESTGYFYYCAYALSAESPYEWAPMKCAFLYVVEDLAPRMSIHPLGNASQDQLHYSLFMGQTLDVVVRTFDNPSDDISFLRISKLDINTGDKYRARIAYVYKDLSTPSKREVALMPDLVEPSIPPFLSCTVGGPVNETFTEMNPHTHDRAISFVPTRMHSGLVFSMCFLAVDARGGCPKGGEGKSNIGSGSEQCFQVAVHRCRYAMGAGQDLPYVAGLFETNWLQLFVLNPLLTTPEVPATESSIINLGHLYRVGEAESLADIIRKFGSTMRYLQFINVDLSPRTEAWWAQTLPVGLHLCIVPDSCTSNA